MSSLKEAKSYFKQCFNIIDLIPSNGVDFRERHEMKGRAKENLGMVYWHLDKKEKASNQF